MKSIILLLPLILLIGCDAFNDPKEYATSVLYDSTGDTLPYDPESIITDFNLDNDPLSGRLFRFSPLTDVDLNNVQEISIPGIVQWSSNDEERSDVIDEFKIGIRRIIPVPSSGFENSSLWIPLIQEIEHLHQLGADHSTLFVISDMLMHDDIMNFYDDQTRSDLFQQPHFLRDQLRRYLPKEKVSNLDVVIVYQPQGSDEKQFFRQMIDSVYTPLFEECGINLQTRVHI